MSYHRKPKTTAEKRANQDWPVRGNRSDRLLPTSWSDLPKASSENRNWKKYRKTKYRVKGKEKK
jgi:hypothetical protein